MNVEQLKSQLQKYGYFTYNLWTIHDVMDKYHCNEEQAQIILKLALTNEATMEQIQSSIKIFAEIEGFKEKKS